MAKANLFPVHGNGSRKIAGVGIDNFDSLVNLFGATMHLKRLK